MSWLTILIFILSNHILVKSFHTFTPLNRRSLSLSMRLFTNFDALLFDCDGVIAETERDAHRVTFNQVISFKILFELMQWILCNNTWKIRHLPLKILRQSGVSINTVNYLKLEEERKG